MQRRQLIAPGGGLLAEPGVVERRADEPGKRVDRVGNRALAVLVHQTEVVVGALIPGLCQVLEFADRLFVSARLIGGNGRFIARPGRRGF